MEWLLEQVFEIGVTLFMVGVCFWQALAGKRLNRIEDELHSDSQDGGNDDTNDLPA